MDIRIRPLSDLSPAEIQDMEDLVQDVDPSLPSDHLRKNHLHPPDLVFYLIYDQEKLQAMQSYRTMVVSTPFSSKPLPVFRGYLTYKRVGSNIRGATSKTSVLHMKRHLGRFWMFKSFVAFAYSPNPRVYIQFRHFFPSVYPQLKAPPSQEIMAFLRENLEYGRELTSWMVDPSNHGNFTRADITEFYGSNYRCRDPKVNEFFFDQEIFIRDGNEIWLEPRSLQMVGHYTPWKGILHLLKQTLGLKS